MDTGISGEVLSPYTPPFIILQGKAVVGVMIL